MSLREYLSLLPQQKLKAPLAFIDYVWVPTLPSVEAHILQVLLFGDTETAATIFWMPILRQVLCGYFSFIVSNTQEMLTLPFC